MIYVDRSSVPKPEILRSDRAEIARNLLRQQHEEGLPLEFDSRIWLATKDDLYKLFHFKCAYCESSIQDARRGVVDHFRPKLRALDLSGKVSEGYWWLAYEWDNLYLSCERCSRYKRNRFPVRGKRAKPFSDLSKEDHTLLDPCKADDFETVHLVFGELGVIASATDRGRVTIEILNLDDDWLRRARHTAQQEARHAVLRIAAGLEAPGDVLPILSPESPYLAAKRQYLQARLRAEPGLGAALLQVAPALVKMLFEDQEVISETRRKQTLEGYIEERVKADQYTIYAESRLEREAYFSSVKRIERVEIKNFKCFRDLVLNFADPDTSLISAAPYLQQSLGSGETFRESWLALIGENATGKSAVLQAIALALMGDEERKRLKRVRASEVVTHGQSEGFVKVHLSGLKEPVSLYFFKDKDAFDTNMPEPKVLILGYGATRLLRDADDPEEDDEALVRILNLFSPFAKLNNVERWLADTDRVPASQFRVVRDALMDLLLLEAGQDKIYRRNSRLYAVRNGRREAFGELSDGYRTVTALALDIMLVLSRKWGNIRDAEGIVLVDEIGAHLHPRWKMQIVGRLRQAFPNIQFVIATHEPLCLRGLRAGEVILLERDENDEVIKVDDLPSPSDLRVDQLLTSEFFGLQSTIDPEVERLFNEYYALLAMEERTPVQEDRHKELQEDLRERKHLGDSPREELMYEVIDQLLAKRQVERPAMPIEKLKQEAVDKVREVWEKHLFRSGESEQP